MCVYILTCKQHSTDWFLARLFRFSSTTFYVFVNVIDAVYFDDPELKELHQKCKDIVKLTPRNRITVDNAMTLEDDDVPNQRSDLILNRKPVANQCQISNHNNCTKESWLRTCKKKPELQKQCRVFSIEFVDTETKGQLATKLGNKFYQDSLDSNEESPADDHLSFEMKQVAFLQKITTDYIFFIKRNDEKTENKHLM